MIMGDSEDLQIRILNELSKQLIKLSGSQSILKKHALWVKFDLFNGKQTEYCLGSNIIDVIKDELKLDTKQAIEELNNELRDNQLGLYCCELADGQVRLYCDKQLTQYQIYELSGKYSTQCVLS